tara:strand:- start:10909 stop:11088 length:180 start_codon:yes stop_codon:yes gene_type:complete
MGGWGPPQGSPSPERREISNLKEEINKLETWLKEKNEQILALRDYIETLEAQIKRQRPV